METLMGVIHGIDIFLNLLLIGSLAFSVLIVADGEADANENNEFQIKFITRLNLAALIMSLIWFVLAVHDMADSWSWSDIEPAILHTRFSVVWACKIFGLTGLLGLLSMRKISFRQRFFWICIGALLPLPYTLTSHASSQVDLIVLRVILDWMHSISAGVWTGGLLSLYLWLGERIKKSLQRENDISYQVVTRFSHYAMLSVGLISISGLLTAYLNQVSVFHIWQNQYSRLLVYKIIFFCLALGAAALNQFLHLRRWIPKSETKFLLALRREIRFEILFILIVFMIVGFLTRAELPLG